MATTSQPISPTFTKESHGITKTTRVHSAGALTSMVASSVAAQLKSLIVTNNTATAGYVLVLDAASLPANGAVPLIGFPLPASDALSLSSIPIFGRTGIVLAVSTTLATLTLSANAALFLAEVTQ